YALLLFSAPPTTVIYTLSLHDALPISPSRHLIPTHPSAVGMMAVSRFRSGACSAIATRNALDRSKNSGLIGSYPSGSSSARRSRSEERRVGKDGHAWWGVERCKENSVT